MAGLYFFKRIHRGTSVAVLFDRLVSHLITVSKEYEEGEEEYKENENGRFPSFFMGSRNMFACLQGQFIAWVFDE